MTENLKCRICMMGKSSQVNIFTNDLNLSLKLMEVADVQVAEGDGLPGVICVDCEADLEKCYNFKNQVQWADKKFREDSSSEIVVEECNIKQEPVSHLDETMMDADNNSEVEADDYDNDIDNEPCPKKMKMTSGDEKFVVGDNTESPLQSENEPTTQPIDHIDIMEHRVIKGDYEMQHDPFATEEPLMDAHVKSDPGPSIDPLSLLKVESSEGMDVCNPGPSTSTFEPSSSKMKTAPRIQLISPVMVADSSGLASKRTGPKFFVQNQPHFLVFVKRSLPPNTIFTASTDSDMNLDLTKNNLASLSSCMVEKIPDDLPPPSDVDLSDVISTPVPVVDSPTLPAVVMTKPVRKVSGRGTKPRQKTMPKRQVAPKTKTINTITPIDDNLTNNDVSFCQVCNVTCGSLELLLEHKESKNIYCRVCLNQFKDHAELETHFTVHPTYTCKCKCVFFARADLMYHKSKSKNETCNEQFQCDQCDKSFSRKRTVNKHKLIYHSEKIVEHHCTVCNKTFKCSNTYNAHSVKAHTAYEYLECTVCNKLILGPYNLKNHMKYTHVILNENVTSLYCPICKKSFVHHLNLEKHMVKHDVTKKKCDLCETVLPAKDMVNHMNMKHSKTGNYTCRTCNEKFQDYISCRRHYRRYHRESPKPVFCEICGKTYKNSTILKSHRRVHSAEKPFVCPTCGVSFKFSGSLVTHQRVHSDVGKFCCKGCGKSFRWKQTFEKHVKNCESVEDNADEDGLDAE